MSDIAENIQLYIENIPVVFILLTFLFATTITIIFSLVLNYHWRRYGVDSPKIHKGKIIYISGVIIFMILAGLSAVIFVMSK